MIPVNGKYNCAYIYSDEIDETSLSQIIELCNQEFVKNSKIRMMPDVHAGMGCTVGTTMTIKDKVVPNLVGVDIGCGMHIAVLKEKHIEFAKLDKVIRENVPSGFATREKPHSFLSQTRLEELKCFKHLKHKIRIEKSVGTLGGGNHFIEVAKDDDNVLYIIIHSGSRYLGVEVASYYQQYAYDSLNSCTSEDINNMIKDLKGKGKQNKIQKEIKKLKSTKNSNIPKHLSYLEGKGLEDYLHDMQIVQEYADINRKAILYSISKKMKFHIVESFSTIHNYIDLKRNILRKGAASAENGEKLLIPINMRDGSLLCIGKGNEDWNFSAPHGAGRIMSRSKAKNSFTVSQFKKEMKDVFTTSVNQETLDECPMAYKPMEKIIDNIGYTVSIEKVLKPVYNFKAGKE